MEDVLMEYDLYQLLWLFFAYSVLGWAAETVVAAVRTHHFVSRGVFGGPVCCVYGFAAVLITLFLPELRGSWFFLFLGSAILSTGVEWAAARILEKIGRRKWWDYSGKRFNLDGYICLQYSVLWGIVGALCLEFVNPLLLTLYRMVPGTAAHILLWVAVVLICLDATGAVLTILGLGDRLPAAEEVNSRMLAVTVRMGNWLTGHVNRRMAKAYPGLQAGKSQRKPQSAVFAEGCSFYKLVLLFFVGAFCGDIVETLFCRVTAGVWMSRSSVVWGPFSIVWGLAISLATLALYNYRNRSDGFLFLFGTVLGGAYEYLCSVFTELAFGKVFWDYSQLPFNLGGRINLLYCFFWGIAAVVWLKYLYPPISAGIEKIPKKPGKILTWCLLVFMAADMTVSVFALARSTARAHGIPAESAVSVWLDEHYGDDVMKRIYPNAISTE
ncbi:MAG: putative ABC transporter permease [Gemmiger sp.]